jgi:hypothetical protein
MWMDVLVTYAMRKVTLLVTVLTMMLTIVNVTTVEKLDISHATVQKLEARMAALWAEIDFRATGMRLFETCISDIQDELISVFVLHTASVALKRELEF